MGTYAVTLSDLIEKGGAYAGLAAFFGLAVLAILYFAQAREIRRLRDWAGRAPERAQELEQRVVQQAETARRVAPAPMRRPGQPATPAAQQQATQVVPAVSEDTASADEEADDQAEDAEEETAAPAEPEIPVAAATAEAASEDSATEHEVVTGEEPVAEEADADAEDEDAAEPATAGTATAVSETGAPQTNGAPPADALPPRATQGPATARPPAAALRSTAPVTRRPPPRGPVPPIVAEEPSGRRRGFMVAGIVAGVILIIVGIIAVFTGGGSDNKQPASAPTSKQPSTTAAPSGTKSGGTKKGSKPSTPSRADTSIAVLNGTTVAGLAGTINAKLEQAGYTKCQDPTNFTDATRSASIVFYDGSINRTQAKTIADSLDVSDVQPITPDAQGVAGCADVVVVVGADQTP